MVETRETLSYSSPMFTANQPAQQKPLFGFGSNTNPTTTQTPFASTAASFGLPSARPATTAPTFSFPQTSSAPSFFSSTQPAATSGFSFGTLAKPENPEEKIWAQLAQVQQDENRAKNPMQPSSGPFNPDNVWQALALLRSWWDPKSPNCQFKHYFYDKVDPKQIHLHQKPANDSKAWDEAQKSNPDPSCMVPVLATGFEDIKNRIGKQDEATAVQKKQLADIEQKIKKLQSSDLVKTAARLDEYKMTQRILAQRVIKFLKHVQVLRCKGLSITAEEETMRAQFENIEDQLKRSEQFHGKLNQMWAQLQLIKESGRRNGSAGNMTMQNTLSEQNILDINMTMDEQQNGIQHLFDTLQADEKVIETLRENLCQ